ncbi:hypothetical protein JTB14_002056 [Gonioctena quinquepunctata]|nr:hypothetical protein JTB14_002056 [Gonioctena quinquepunctata]
MREETSPPREPSPNQHHHHQHSQHHYHQQQLQSPRIRLVPSPEPLTSSPPLSPAAVILISSTAAGSTPPTNRPSASRPPPPWYRRPTIPGVLPTRALPSTTFRLSIASTRPSSGGRVGFSTSSPKFVNRMNPVKNSDPSSKQASHSFKKKYVCDCQNQICPTCVNKNQERNINNNLTNVNNNVMGSPNMLTVSRANSRGKLRQQSSSLGSFESSTNSPCLSRDSSSEQYTDTTGVDLEQFIPETLNRNAKDRALMLRIEQELVNLAKDRCKTHYKFPPMSSYQRMLVHRCAAYFGMDHNIEPTGKSVVVNKTKCTRIPEIEFKEHVKEDIVFSEEPRRSILKRDSNSIEDYSFKSPDRSFSLESRRSKSFEEREEEYEKVRRRIFNREEDKWPFLWQMQDASSEDFGWSEMPWSSMESDCSSKCRLLPPDIHRRQMGKLMKGHSEETGEATRPCVAKSYSFGGYGGNISVLSRGDSVLSTHSAGPRLLTKQDSGASSVSWRLSPSSSGYKSQSQMSESVTPSPTSTPHPVMDARQDSNCSSENQDHHEGGDTVDNHVVWAVTDMQNVPRGSIIINPQTGKPVKNEDGSIYHYDPTNIPPVLCQIFGKVAAVPPLSPQKPPCRDNFPLSPKKMRSVRSSPTLKTQTHLTNSSTSPIMPFSPPLVSSSGQQPRSYTYVTAENVSNLPPQQQFSGYSTTFASPATGESGTVYQQPYLVYTAPYGVHVQQQFDGRMEPPTVPEMASTFYVPESAGPPQAQTIAYQPTQPPHYWNHPVTYYANNTQPQAAAPPQRFPSVPLQTTGQQGYLPTAYPPNYIQPPSNNPPILLN